MGGRICRAAGARRDGEVPAARLVGRIDSGDLCTVEPLGKHVLEVGEIVLCRVKGAQYLHLVKAVRGDRYQIGNNRGGVNGWIGRAQIYGRLLSVTP